MRFKKFIIYFFLFTTFVACVNQQEKVIKDNKRNSVIIVGHFENVENLDSLSTIGIYAQDFLTKETFSVERKLDSTKKFKFEFDITTQQDIMILYNNIISLIVEPGDSIYLILDAKSNSRKDVFKNLKITGTNSNINRELINYFINERIDYDIYNSKRNDLSNIDFKEYKDSIYKVQTDYINRTLANENLPIPLKNWLEAEKLFGLAGTYGFSGFSNAVTKKEIENQNFQDLYNIKDLPKIKREHLINTKVSNISSSIAEFYILQNLTGSGILHDNWEQISITQALKENSDNPFLSKLIINHIIQISLTNSNLKIYDDNIKLIDSMFKETDFKETIEKKYVDVRQQLKYPKITDKTKILDFQSNEISNILKEIIAESNGKPIYIDHWATWCRPCINEFKENTPKLVEKFEDDVEFIYFCYKSKKEHWKAAISKYQLKGKHYFIEDSQLEDLSNLFAIKGYPTYTIVGKNGEIIISNSLYRPGNSETSRILNELIK